MRIEAVIERKVLGSAPFEEEFVRFKVNLLEHGVGYVAFGYSLDSISAEICISPIVDCEQSSPLRSYEEFMQVCRVVPMRGYSSILFIVIVILKRIVR